MAGGVEVRMGGGGLIESTITVAMDR